VFKARTKRAFITLPKKFLQKTGGGSFKTLTVQEEIGGGEISISGTGGNVASDRAGHGGIWLTARNKVEFHYQQQPESQSAASKFPQFQKRNVFIRKIYFFFPQVLILQHRVTLGN
jgi:hypothetical protein